MTSILLVKKFGGLVDMTFALVNASYELARMASCKNDFLCTLVLQHYNLTNVLDSHPLHVLSCFFFLFNKNLLGSYMWVLTVVCSSSSYNRIADMAI